MYLFVVGLSLLQIASGLKVYSWHRQWDTDLQEKEFACVDGERKTILHSSLKEVFSHHPVISHHDYSFANADFPNGIVAIRPLLSSTNQVCFITPASLSWKQAKRKVKNRHGTNITKDAGDKFVLDTSLPGDFDPYNVSSVREFCDVTNDFIFYLRPIDSVSGYRKLKLQGMFQRFLLGVPSEFETKVFGSPRV